MYASDCHCNCLLVYIMHDTMCFDQSQIVVVHDIVLWMFMVYVAFITCYLYLFV